MMLALIFCLGVAACGSDKTEETKETANDTAQAGTEDGESYSGEVTVNIYRATSGEILTKIKTEAEAGQLAGDVLWVADFSSAESLKEAGLLAQ